MFRIVSGIAVEHFSGLVPEMLKRSFEDIPARCVEIWFPVSASAKNSMNQSVALDHCLEKAARSYDDSRGFAHVLSITRSHDFHKVFVCVR